MVVSPVKAPLQPHQIAALESICEYESLLIEYGTGTGKTMIIVEACKIFLEVGDVPVLILVPNSLIEQTVEEFVQWAGGTWTAKNVKVLDASFSVYDRREQLKRGRDSIYILSHESLSYPLVKEGVFYRRWKVVLVDEGSRFRNPSKRTQTLKTLGTRAESRYAFSGNLLVRTPADLFYVMDWLTPGIFGTRRRDVFIAEFCLMGGYMGNQAIDIRPDKIDQLRDIMDANRIKCELRDIRDLPPRELSVRAVDMPKEQAKAYTQMRDELKLEIERLGEPDFISNVRTYATRLQRLQEVAAGFARNLDGDIVNLPSPKTKELIELLSDTPEIPTVVWYWWVPERDRIAIELLRAKIPHSVLGRPGARADFLSGKTNVFIAQLAKGGYGLNLTRATRMIYHSLPWDLDLYMQSQERNMRLTTTADFLEVIHLQVRHTADGYVRSSLLDKAGISSKLSKSQALELLRGV